MKTDIVQRIRNPAQRDSAHMDSQLSMWKILVMMWIYAFQPCPWIGKGSFGFGANGAESTYPSSVSLNVRKC